MSEKYGSPGLVMQAHNNHLLQAQPVRVGDFNALFILAADVREVVSSVSDEHIVAFTYSTVIFSLASNFTPNSKLTGASLPMRCDQISHRLKTSIHGSMLQSAQKKTVAIDSRCQQLIRRPTTIPVSNNPATVRQAAADIVNIKAFLEKQPTTRLRAPPFLRNP